MIRQPKPWEALLIASATIPVGLYYDNTPLAPVGLIGLAALCMASWGKTTESEEPIIPASPDGQSRCFRCPQDGKPLPISGSVTQLSGLALEFSWCPFCDELHARGEAAYALLRWDQTRKLFLLMRKTLNIDGDELEHEANCLPMAITRQP